MVDHSHKGFFFAATALMWGLVFYGSQLASADKQLSPTTSGLPRQLTLPPGMNSDVPPELTLLQHTTLAAEPCATKPRDNPTRPEANPACENGAPKAPPGAAAAKAEPGAVTNLSAAAK